MSESNQPEHLDEPVKYAPKWLRERQAKPHTPEAPRLPAAPQLVVSDEPPGASSPRSRDPPFEGDVAIERMRIQRSLESERVGEPEWTQPSSFLFSTLLRASVSIGLATLGVLAYMGELPIPFGRAPQGTATREIIGSDQRVAAPAETSRAGKMADLVGNVRAPAPTEPAPAPTEPAPAPTEPAPARAEPAPARAEAAPQAAEPAEAPRPEKPVGLASTSTKPWPDAPAPTAVPAARAPATAAPTGRQLAPEEIEILIRRGEAFISQGDISPGRLMLKRAAEAGSARAALALGGTYDPDVLRKMRVLGFQPDTALAREWYQKAAALGSDEAARRLAGLR